MRRVLIGVLLLLLLLAAPVVFDYAMPHASARLLIDFARGAADLEAARTTAGGLDIAYLHGGAGEPLVLVHGFGGNKDNFTRIARHLTPHYRLIVPDLPGFGESAKPADAGYGVPEQVERLRAFLQQQGLRRVHLGGNSMGGYIATAYAAKYPDEVASLWLLAPAGTAAAADTELMRHYQDTGEILLLIRSPDDLRRVVDFVFARPPFSPPSVRRVVAEQAIANRPLHERIFRQLAEQKDALLENLVTEPLATRALVVWGAQDRVLNPKGAQAMQALLPRAQVVMLDGVGHVPMMEAPERCAEDYLKFRHNSAP